MKHKVVFFDMDGTLYQTANDIIQDSTIETIEKLREKGYMVCTATGRPLNQMEKILKQVQFDYYILLNGGYVLDGAFTEVEANPIPRDYCNDIVEMCKEHNFGLAFHFGDATYIYNNFYPVYDFLKYCNVLDSLFYDQTQSFHKRHRAFDAVVIAKDKRTVDQFMEKHPSLRSDLINIKTDGFAFDIFNANNDKAVGIDALLHDIGVSWDEVICFGDSTNDIQMLQKAGIGVAMGNATDYVKSFANFSTTSVFEDGIANAFKKIWQEEE